MALFKNTRTRTPDPDAAGLAEIDAWEVWFRAGHAQRISRLSEFGDADNPELVAAERARIDALATAAVAMMRQQYVGRPKP